MVCRNDLIPDAHRFANVVTDFASERPDLPVHDFAKSLFDYPGERLINNVRWIREVPGRLFEE